ncbi:uncharacterized protein LOC127464192 [Manacus candei]|uniref:uncharacterized protein LOC127464192 n=1 Tax=Manacus candei TaxID=415023 RepID=UPI002226A609|nr:uncharacterized protein LOC127464192 [Manacus candei]
MIWAIPGFSCWILVGIFALLPPSGARERPKTGMEHPGSPFSRDGDPARNSQRCGVTFHTPNPCGPSGPSPASRRDLEELRELLEDSKAALRSLEAAAARQENGSRFQDVVARALPAIHEANLEFRESLENVRRELEEHVAREENSRLEERKEELRQGVRVVSHVLLLTGRLARSLEDNSQRIHLELSRNLRNPEDNSQRIHTELSRNLRNPEDNSQRIHPELSRSLRSDSEDTEH